MQISQRSIIVLLTSLLLLAGTGIGVLYPLATRTLVRPGDEPMVEKAYVDAGTVFHGDASHRSDTFPIVGDSPTGPAWNFARGD